MSQPKVSVIILNWNTKHFLAEFLPTVIQTNYPNLEVIVADNGSTDGSANFVKENFKNVKLITFDKNYGFCGGYNRAVKFASGEYVVLLNSDIEVTPNWLNPIINFMEENKDVFACQPKLLSYFERNRFEYAGASGGFIDKLGYPFCRGRIFNYCEEDLGQYDEIKQVFWATGACMVIRKKFLDEIGFLDEDFFAHMEEIDLCWRANLHGYKIFCIPQSVVYHVGGGTLPKTNPKKTFFNYRNSLIMLEKNLALIELLFVIPLRLLFDILSAFVFLFKGNFGDFIAVFKAHLDFWLKQHKWIKKRIENRKNIKMRKIDNNLIFKGSIVIEHFVLGKKRFSELKF
ncbi:MAG: glycosyltransferase family 2 protein [Candidatus Kryptonium sp.]|nr:glycosyltransferase family 2 protein [Candidatus Kryptonium sp.]MCX7762884.1 glycosyltransferase family 2 protein [Candidatus Kryptonium sp.]MDW8109448.1 glycosyltransferase family 2 protein [Candidatus Kryptonium sp.]